MLYSELNNILTENEQKIYLELLKLGESTAAPILKATGLQNSVFYRTIHRLMEKGYVTYILKGKIKHFKPADPKSFLLDIKKKESELKEIMPKLEELQKQSQNKSNAEVFIGFKGLLSMYYQLIEDAKKDEKYYFFGPKESIAIEAMEKVYLPFRRHRKNKNLKVYGLNNKKTKKQIKKFPGIKEKFTNFPLPSNMAIFRDKIVLTSWGDVPTGILIQSKDIAEQYKELFFKIWEES